MLTGKPPQHKGAAICHALFAFSRQWHSEGFDSKSFQSMGKRTHYALTVPETFDYRKFYFLCHSIEQMKGVPPAFNSFLDFHPPISFICVPKQKIAFSRLFHLQQHCYI